MKLDSKLISHAAPSYGYRKGKYRPRGKVTTIVIHTTGAGPWRKWKQSSAFETPFEAALDSYGKMSAGPHYVVGQEGQIAQVCPEELAAWHVGSSGRSAYVLRNGKPGRAFLNPKYDWWRERWALSSPVQLGVWATGSVNEISIGIEVTPPRLDPRAHWTQTAYLSISNLVQDIACRHGVSVGRTSVLTHSDVHPISRTTRSGRPWDPMPNQYSWEALSVHL